MFFATICDKMILCLIWRKLKIYLYHFYDASMRPFQNISDVSIEEARKILKDIASKKPDTQCAKGTTGYMELRHHYEDILRCEFMKKGGNIQRQSPHYMVVEHSPWLASWFENSVFIKIDIDKFDKSTIFSHMEIPTRLSAQK